MCMRRCCPKGHGCNAPGGGEPCALDLCRESAAHDPCAALAVARWSAWLQASEGRVNKRERRFRLRGYERARDQALVSLLMSTASNGHSQSRRRSVRKLRSRPLRVRTS